MKKLLSMALAISMIFTSFFGFASISYAENENVISVVSMDGNYKEQPTIGTLKFTIKNGYPLKKVAEFEAKDGKATLPELKDGFYNISLEENQYYDLMDDELTVENGICSFGTGSDTTEDKLTVELKMGVKLPKTDDKTKKVEVVDDEGNKITDEISFVLSSVDNFGKSTKLSDIMSKDGFIVFNDLKDGNYSLVIDEHANYETEEDDGILLSVKNGKFDFGNGTDKITLYKKANVKPEPKPEDDEPITKAIMVNDSKGNFFSSKLAFEVEVDGKKKTVETDNNGTVELEVKLNKDYTIDLVKNDKYEMETVKAVFNKTTNDLGLPVYELINKADNKKIEKFVVKEKANINPPKKEVVKYRINILCGTCGNVSIAKELKFKLVSDDGEVVYKSNSGIIEVELAEGKNYEISLLEDPEYKFDNLKFNVKKSADGKVLPYGKDNKVLKDLVMTKKPGTGCVEGVCEFSDKRVKIKDIPVKVDESGLLRDLKDDEEVIFNLYNTSRSERVGEVKPVNGKLSLEVYEKDDYILFTSSKNKKFILSDTPFEKEVSELYFAAQGEGKFPIRYKTKNPYANGAKLDINKLVVRPLQKDEVVSDKYVIDYIRIAKDKEKHDYSKLKFIFTSEYDTIEATTLQEDEWGTPLTPLALYENVQYSVKVVDPDNKYAIINFPFVLVDKSERGPHNPNGWGDGKYAFNHSFCGNATYLKLVKKGTENDGNTTVTCSNGNTTISGMNFRDLMLRTIHPDKNEVKGLADKDFDVFRFKLINPKRCEVTKMADGDFTIYRTLKKDKVVKQVYQLNKDGSLTKLEFKQDKNVVNINTNTLSIYDTVIEYETKEVKPENPTNPTKPVEPRYPIYPIYPEEPDFSYNHGKAMTDLSSNKTEEVPAKKIETKENPTPILEQTDFGIVKTLPTQPVNLTDIPQNETGAAITNMVSRGILKGMDNGKFEGKVSINRAMVATVLMRISKDKTTTSSNFTDVKENDWFKNAVNWAAKHGYVKGYEDGSFNANKKVTRQEFALILYRFLLDKGIKLENVKNSTPNLDGVAPWAKDAVETLSNAGIVNGKEFTNYDANGEFTREELAVTLDKIIKIVEKN